MTGGVAFQGVPGAYSEAAARRYFGDRVQTRPLPEFADVLAAVARGKAARAVLPVENSLAGPVTGAIDLLCDYPVQAVGEVTLPVVHCLMAPAGVRLADLREVWSHPQALAQCVKSITALKGVRPTEQFDTAGSAELVAKSSRRDLAAIASADAARLYGLKVLRRSFADDRSNQTRFLVLAPRQKAKAAMAEGKLKTTVAFTLPRRPLALHGCLDALASHGFDVVRLVPRPVRGAPWRPLYHADFTAAPRRPSGADALGQALTALAGATASLHVLGTYPVAEKERS